MLAACTTDEPKDVEIRLNNLDSMQILVGVPGDRVDPPNDPAREGYLFNGWFSDEEKTIPYVFGLMPDDSIDIYAGWETLNYDLTFQLASQAIISQMIMTESMVFMEIEGELWCWGRSTERGGGSGKPNITTFDRCPASSIEGQDTIWPGEWAHAVSVGKNHALVLDENGSLYAWGDNTYGQLGTGDLHVHDTFVNMTDRFPLIEREQIERVVTSDTNTYAISSFGRVFGWGLALGLPGNPPSTYGVVPRPLDITEAFTFTEDETIVDFVAAYGRAYVLSSTGQLYGFGNNDEGQLGFIEERPRNTVTNITQYFVSEDESIRYIDAKNDGFFLLKDQGDACMITGGIARTDNQVTCTATPFDGEELASILGDLDAADIRNYRIAFNGRGLIMKTAGNDSNGEIEIFTYTWGELPIGFSSDQAEAINAFLKIAGPEGNPNGMVVTDDDVCMLDEDAKLYCWGASGISPDLYAHDHDDHEINTIVHYVGDDHVPDYLDLDDDGDGIPTTFESPNIFTFEMRLDLPYQVPFGFDVLGDTSWFEAMDQLIDASVFTRAEFDDYALGCGWYFNCLQVFENGMPAEAVVMRLMVDTPRFKAGALIIKGSN